MRAGLVFSDLDGSLLDHHTYSFEAARPALAALARSSIPLIMVSSKTCSEILPLRSALSNAHPFIVENGAAVFIPQGYFTQQPVGAIEKNGFWVYATSPPRSHWVDLLEQLEAEFPESFDYFHKAGVRGIMRMTGLSEQQSRQANERDYSEPVRWLAAADAEHRFIDRLCELGASVHRGGRFLAVSGDTDKGRALCWLRDRYRENMPATKFEDLAIGDSDNDRQMLEAATSALLVRSPVHAFPSVNRIDRTLHSSGVGPEGWAEGVLQWLEKNSFPCQES